MESEINIYERLDVLRRSRKKFILMSLAASVLFLLYFIPQSGGYVSTSSILLSTNNKEDVDIQARILKSRSTRDLIKSACSFDNGIDVVANVSKGTTRVIDVVSTAPNKDLSECVLLASIEAYRTLRNNAYKEIGVPEDKIMKFAVIDRVDTKQSTNSVTKKGIVFVLISGMFAGLSYVFAEDRYKRDKIKHKNQTKDGVQNG